jgi:hypothetical protein
MRTPAAGRNKFEDPINPSYPPAIPAWRRAAQDFDVWTTKFVYKLIPTDLGYVFPEPAAFVAVTCERQEAFFRGWLKYRKAMLYRVSSGDFNAQPMPQGLWRDFLTLEYVQELKCISEGGNPPDGEGASLQKKTMQNYSGGMGRSAPNTRSKKH